MVAAVAAKLGRALGSETKVRRVDVITLLELPK
jgi:hypothetical protein